MKTAPYYITVREHADGAQTIAETNLPNSLDATMQMLRRQTEAA